MSSDVFFVLIITVDTFVNGGQLIAISPLEPTRIMLLVWVLGKNVVFFSSKSLMPPLHLISLCTSLCIGCPSTMCVIPPLFRAVFPPVPFISHSSEIFSISFHGRAGGVVVYQCALHQ